MSQKLVIVESPNKVKKIQSYLGQGYIVKASVGHIRDLPMREMGINENTHEPNFIISKDKTKIVAGLKKIAQNVSDIYLATDPDREGEAIAWHLKEVLGAKYNYHRVFFNEITKSALADAFAKPTVIDLPMVQGANARRVLDRYVGYKVSPAITQLEGQKFTAGRVQSPAVALVVMRQLERDSFEPEDYLNVFLTLNKDGMQWKATLDTDDYTIDGELFDDQSIADLASGVDKVTVTDVSKAEKSQSPYPPFITSTLQQAASSVLKIKPKRTMSLAQILFGEGLITYHRTDSFSLSSDAIEAIRIIAQKQNYATPVSPRSFKNKAGAQEGHEAIRPSDMYLESLSLSVGNGIKANDISDLQRLYILIRNRTIASQLDDHVIDVTKVKYIGTNKGNDFDFTAKCGVTKNKGWKVISAQQDEDQVTMPLQQIGDVITDVKGSIENKQTKIPNLYTEATLIKALEVKGIGRPSTYASIMERIDQHGYVCSVNKQFIDATTKGVILFNLLHKRFSFLRLTYTKEMEQQIDDIAHSKLSYKDMVQGCYSTLVSEVKALSGVERQSATYHCDKKNCTGEMRRIATKRSAFWGCSAFNDGCKNTWQDNKGKPITPDHPAFVNSVEQSQKKAVDGLNQPVNCSLCDGGVMLQRNGAKGVFLGCSNFPKCKNTQQISKVA